MIRLDKYLSHMNYGTRKEVKKLIRKGLVCVNEIVIKNDDFKVDEKNDIIHIGGEQVFYQEFYYLMLNKPKGYVSATVDERYPTVLELIAEAYAIDLFPIGRLDVDTEGLLLLSNDGSLSHALLSPKKHVDKKYYVVLEKPISQNDIHKLEAGIAINEEETCKEAQVERLSENSIYLMIQEGKFHQVKRMAHAINNEVTYLKRVKMGTLILDESLASGEYRSLNEEEIKRLKGVNR